MVTVGTTATADDRTELAVRLHGGPPDAPVVVLVHGYPDTRAVWDEVVPLLRDAHRVVTFDVRGFGDSQRPDRRDGYDLRLLARDVVAVADTVAPGERVHLVGHDWGGVLGFEVACDPELSRRLASFTCVSGFSFDHAGQSLRRALTPWRLRPDRLAGIWGQVRHSWYAFAMQVPLLAEGALRSGLVERALTGAEGLDPRHGRDRAAFLADATAGLELYRRNLRRVARPRPGELHVPTLVVLGRQDPFVTETVHDLLPERGDDVELRMVEGGHWLPRSRPVLVADAVAAHVGRVGDGVLHGSPVG